MSSVTQKEVSEDEDGMRLDRWFKSHFPGLGFGPLQKLMRSGQVRIDGGRVKTDTRVKTGQTVRIPPNASGLIQKPLTKNTMRDQHDEDVLKSMLLYEDPKVFVFNKPAGLAVQGGSGINRHVDGMLESMRNKKGERPRLVHRLDRDTSGVLVVAKTRGAAADLAKSFRKRETEKIYWALVKGIPKNRDGGRISNYLQKVQTPDGDRMRVAHHGDRGADHAVSFYRVIDDSPRELSWIELKPETGRTHQLRVHCQSMGHPIIGDNKYFDVENWELPGGIQKKLHLHARRLIIPNPSGGMIDVVAPLSPHMVQSWNLFSFDEQDAELDY